MDILEGDAGRERHFVLHIMSFVYGLGLKPLQHSLQKMLDKYPREYESYCTKNITRALLIYISDYMESKETLVDLTSPAYQDQIEDLSDMYSPFDFLRFLALYALKSRSEYYEKKYLDSPMRFYSSMVRFLEEMKQKNRCGFEFWEDLDKAAGEVVVKGLEFREGDAALSDYENETSEREFVLMLMNIVSNLYSNPLPDYLRRELDEFMLTSLNDFPPSFENALTIATDNLERNVYIFSGDDGPIYDFYYRLATRSFNARYFLEFLLCCTRRALLEYYVESKIQSPLVAFDRLCLILQNAKQEGKLRSVEALIEGANEIIADEKMRMEATAAISDASTEFFSDISTESTGGRESMFKSFEQSLPTVDSEKAVSCKNAQSTIGSLAPSTGYAQSTIDSGIAPGRDGQACIEKKTTPLQNTQINTKNETILEAFLSAIKNAVANDKNSQLAIENVIASGENGQPAIENVNTSGENGQPAIENVNTSGEIDKAVIEKMIVSGENGRPAIENVNTSGEIGKPVIEKMIASGENGQPAIENVNTSGEIGKSVIEKMIASGESGQPAIENSNASGENVQPATEKMVDSGKNGQSAIEKVMIFGDNAKAGDPESLVASSEKTSNERPCRCCTTL
nr:uncharacterized protein LOC107443944 [Parasteatoda tepidariorum]